MNAQSILGRAAVLLAGGLILGGGTFIYPYLSARDHLLAWNVAIAVPLSLLMAWWRRTCRVGGSIGLAWLPVAAFAGTLLIEVAAESWWPNSGDEYGYTFLAKTLLHGRVWNPPPPAPVIFDPNWIFVRDGKWFSQYPPAWPALLAPFLAAGAGWLVNPLLTLAMGVLAARIFRLLAVQETVARALLFLLLFSPFVLFNGASLFAHTMSAALVLACVWLQMLDEARPAGLTKLGIGCAFGLQLLTRYEVLVLTAVPFVIDRLWFRRAAFLRDAAVMALGGLPAFVLFAAYNMAITGNPLLTPIAWASTGARLGFWGKHVQFGDALLQAVLRTLYRAGGFFEFTSPLLACLAAAALVVKLRSGTVRWYDGLLPVAVVFFFFYPSNAGHEFGPRYWFFAWPTAVLTIATGLADGSGGLRLGRWHLPAHGLALCHAPVFLGVCIAFAAFNHLYVDQRRLVLPVDPPLRPAVVLIPSRHLWLTHWQTAPLGGQSADFARNGVDATGDVLLGRADADFQHAEEFTALACTLIDRHIYRWRAPHVLEPVVCP